MPSNDDHARLRNLGTVIGAPESGLRYMRRRRIGTADRNGDPLDGLVNLWDIALVLAVAFLLAALTGVGLSGIVSGEDLTVVTNPGQPDMQVITKTGTTIETSIRIMSRWGKEGLVLTEGDGFVIPDVELLRSHLG